MRQVYECMGAVTYSATHVKQLDNLLRMENSNRANAMDTP